jgi:GH24 family phage-related lysozyme (muramidase)
LFLSLATSTKAAGLLPPSTLQSMFNLEDAIQFFRQHEGVVSHMYLDVVGLVTIGVGFLLPNTAAAQALNLIRRDTGDPGSDEEKAQDWESVHAQSKARPAASYQAFTRLDLPDAEIDRVLAGRIQDFTRNLRQHFPNFDAFPDAAQIGLLDMIYSLGPQGLFKGFPKFCAAAEAQDWTACAHEGARRNVSQTRNDDLKRLFQEAANSNVTSV